MPFYAVKVGRQPGVYETWWVRSFIVTWFVNASSKERKELTRLCNHVNVKACVNRTFKIHTSVLTCKFRNSHSIKVSVQNRMKLYIFRLVCLYCQQVSVWKLTSRFISLWRANFIRCYWNFYTWMLFYVWEFSILLLLVQYL